MHRLPRLSSATVFALLACACGPDNIGTGDDVTGDTGDTGDTDSSTGSSTTGETDGACLVDEDCPPDMECIQGMCGYDPCLDSGCDTWGGCVVDEDCPLGESCQDGVCVDSSTCSSDADCPDGVCMFFSCQPAPTLPACGQAITISELPIPEALVPVSYARAAVGDFDGDGLGEVVALREADSTILEVFGLGDATATATTALIEPLGTALLPLAIDDDGIPDLISDQDLWRGDGAGGFTNIGMLEQLEPFERLAAGDLDGDGLPEPVELEGEIVAWRNTGGDFELLDPIGPALAATVGDFDGDQRSTIVVFDSSTALDLRYDGGGWSPSPLFDIAGQTVDLAAVRAPGGGHDDLVFSDHREGGDTLIVVRRDRQPLIWWQITGVQSRPTPVDIDGDGDDELLYIGAGAEATIVDLDGCTRTLPLSVADDLTWEAAAGNLDDDPAEELVMIINGALQIFDPQ